MSSSWFEFGNKPAAPQQQQQQQPASSSSSSTPRVSSELPPYLAEPTGSVGGASMPPKEPSPSPGAAAGGGASRQRGQQSDPQKAAAALPPSQRQLAPSPIKMYAEPGKAARDVLYGNKAEGLFAFGTSKVSLSSSTASGVSFLSNATRSDNAVNGLFSVALPSYRGWLAEGSLLTSGTTEVTLVGAHPSLAPFKVSSSVVLPPPAAGTNKFVMPSAKLGVDYSGRNLNGKLTATAEQRPLFTATAVTGAGRLALGGEVVYDSRPVPPGSKTNGTIGTGAYGKVTRLGVAGTYIAPEYSFAANHTYQPAANTSTSTIAYSHVLTPDTSLGLELVYDAKYITSPAPAPAIASTIPTGEPAAAGASAGGHAATAAGTSGVGARGAGGAGGDVGLGGGVGGGGGSRVSITGTPRLAAGLSFRVKPGAYVKVKAESNSQLSILYKDTLSTGPKITLCAQVDAKDLSKVPRVGLTVDI